MDDDGTTLFVRKLVPARQAGVRAANLTISELPRGYVPMLFRPRVMHNCYALVLCHLGVRRTLRMLEGVYWCVSTESSTRRWIRHCLRCRGRNNDLDTVRWPTLTTLLPNGPDELVSVDYFGALVVTVRHACILIFTDRFNRRADMFAITSNEFRNYCQRGYRPTTNHGLQFCLKLSVAVC